MATAFVQKGAPAECPPTDRRPSATNSEPTGDRQSPADATPEVASVRRWFTWRNALLGAVVAGVAILSVAVQGCDANRDQIGGVTRLNERFEEASIEAATVPADLPARVVWRFDGAAPSWRAVPPWNPTVAPARVEQEEGVLRVELTDGMQNHLGKLVGGAFTELARWDPADWGTVEVQVRFSDPLSWMGVGRNLRTGSGGADAAPWPFLGGAVRTVNATAGDTATIRVELPEPDAADADKWQELGLWFGAEEPVSVEILAVRMIPREERFAASSAGVAPTGGSPPDGSAPSRTVPSALYMWTPGKAEYSVQVPPNGHLDVSPGVVRRGVPIRFRVSVTPGGGEPEVLLETVVSDPARSSTRTLDLSHLAGQRVELALQAEPAPGAGIERATGARAGPDAQLRPVVALWGDPTVYAPARLAVEIRDAATGERTPVRIRFTRANGAIAPLPDAAIGVQWGWNDQASGYQLLPDGSFYVDGAFDSELPPGEYRIAAMKGYEYLEQDVAVTLRPGEDVGRTIRLERWIDMPARGWYSADDHIHLRRSPRENPLILKWVAAEDIHVGALLQMGDFWTTYFAQYAWGKDGVYRLEDYMLTSGQEDPRTHEIGHTISLAADDFVRYQGDYYHYDQVFDHVHELGGVSGYAHQGVAFHGYRGLTLDVLREKVDFLELLQFCDSDGPLHLEHYYHFLDLGFELTALAGSDFPWCRGRIGDARFYTYLGDDFSFESWRQGLRAGHTFVSSGPALELMVNGKIPGDRLDVPEGSTLHTRALAFGHSRQVPLTRLEVVAHGEVIATATAGEPGQSSERLAIELELPAERGLWMAARTEAGPAQAAHTTPVYVSVDGSGFHNPETALAYLDLNERYLDELEARISRPNQTLNQHAWRYREGLEARIAETRAVIATLRERFRSGR